MEISHEQFKLHAYKKKLFGVLRCCFICLFFLSLQLICTDYDYINAHHSHSWCMPMK